LYFKCIYGLMPALREVTVIKASAISEEERLCSIIRYKLRELWKECVKTVPHLGCMTLSMFEALQPNEIASW